MSVHGSSSGAAMLAALLCCAALSMLGCGSSGGSATTPQSELATGPGGFVGAELPGSTPAPDFTLTDQSGRAVSLRSFAGQPVLLAFVYSSCGAVCIVIAQQIRGALNELRRPVPVLLVSAEPRADTPAHVASFLAQVSLTGRVHYLTGSPAQLRQVWSAYHVHPAATSGRSAFEKYATVTLIDRQGDERVLYSEEQLTPEALAHDIVKLQSG